MMSEIINFEGKGCHCRSIIVRTIVDKCFECKEEKKVLGFDSSDTEYTEMRFCIECLKRFDDGFISKSDWSVDYTNE